MSVRTQLSDMRKNAAAWRSAKQAGIPDREVFAMIAKANIRPDWSKRTVAMFMAEFGFARWWDDAGQIVYELSHDIAAMFSLTSCPSIEWKHAPHDAFAVKVPREFLPVESPGESPDTWILAGSAGALVVADYDTTAECFLTYDPEYSEGAAIEKTFGDSKMALLANRMLSNLLAYVNEPSARFERKAGFSKRAESTFVVRPPRDVVVTREFRDAARAAVLSSSLAGTRRALAHMVRGHWRNQAVGEGRQERRMTWVRPHRRGDESLGRVVQRIERITTKEVQL